MSTHGLFKMDNSNVIVPRIILLLLLGLALSPVANAGLAPHNVLVVINEASWTSKAVANEYIRLRKIPPANVISLADVPVQSSISVEDFRQKILKPIILTSAHRGISNQIECIAYSTDFPWRIDLGGDLSKRLPAGKKLPKHVTPYGSLTGMTYLLEYVFREDLNYLQLTSNSYFRQRIRAGRVFTGSESEKVQLRESLKLIEEKKWPEAQIILERLLKRHDHVSDLWYNYACCLARNENYLEALKALEKAVDRGFSKADKAEEDEDFKSLRSTEQFRELTNKMRHPVFETQKAYAFSHNTTFDVPFAQQPVHYLMSTMLGVTAGRGNSIAEITNSLKRSTEADATQPTVSFYFSKNKDVRSTTREPWFDAAVAKLREQGRHALILDGTVPRFRRDIGGLMAGTAGFDWPDSHSVIQPGAICEHLTSYGGVMNDGAGQTPISEWIRYGAAGTSGTVFEPYALQQKFPTAFLHVYYSRGFSLAESFYLSVQGPYQLLILGDPLCQPWATPPDFEVGFQAGQKLDTAIRLPMQEVDEIGRFAILVDGVIQASTIPGVLETLHIDNLSDGDHTLTVVGLGKEETESPHQKSFPFSIHRYAKNIELKHDSDEETPCSSLGETFTVHATCEDAEKINILHNLELLGTIEGDAGQIKIPAEKIGMGEVQLYALGVGDGWAIRSKDLPVKISPPPLRKPIGPSRGLPLKAGLLLSSGSRKQPLESLSDPNWMTKAGLKPGDEFELAAFHDADAEDLYQFQVEGNTPIEVKLNGVPVELPGLDAPFRCVPLSLGRGRHRLSVKGTMQEEGQLKLYFGNQGRPLADTRHFKIRR